LSLFINTVMSLHLCVCYSRRTGCRPIRNDRWKRHSICRRIETILLLLVGEGVASTQGVKVSVVPDRAWAVSFISVPWGAASTSFPHIGLSFRGIVVCCAVLRGQFCDMCSVPPHRYQVAGCPLYDILARYPQ
jgi:hypothetical protein